MIDTVKFKIENINSDIYKKIKTKSIETNKFDHKLNNLMLRYYNCNVFLPSYNKDINIFFDEIHYNTIYFELSLPKFYYGNNLVLLYADIFPIVCNELYIQLKDYFNEFPTIDNWQIIRLDICYSWKLENQNQALSLIELLKAYHFPRHKNYPFHDSIYTKSNRLTTKFYLKQNEFKKNDMQKLIKNNLTEYATEVYTDCEGVLRFEVELRRKALKEKFNKDIILIKDINNNLILSLLQYYFSIIMKKKNTQFEDYSTILQKLRIFYSNRTALRLFSFYNLFHSNDITKRESINQYHRSTISRNIKLLRDAKIGLPNDDYYNIPKNFDFNIPSKNVVKLEKYATAARRGVFIIN